MSKFFSDESFFMGQYNPDDLAVTSNAMPHAGEAMTFDKLVEAADMIRGLPAAMDRWECSHAFGHRLRKAFEQRDDTVPCGPGDEILPEGVLGKLYGVKIIERKMPLAIDAVCIDTAGEEQYVIIGGRGMKCADARKLFGLPNYYKFAGDPDGR